MGYNRGMQREGERKTKTMYLCLCPFPTGNSLGTIVTMPLCGFLIAWVGWPSVFYFSGGVAILWVLLWGLLMHDTPAQHPRISPQERDYILQALHEESKKGKVCHVVGRSRVSGRRWRWVSEAKEKKK